jgi:hypothetical protein
MSWFGVGKVGLHMLLMVALVLAPGAASALLLGDQVTAVLTDLDSSTDIINGTAIVVNPAVEFSTSVGSSDWTLDILDNGFVLEINCSDPGPCNSPSGVMLSLSSLDFSPPSSLLALAPSSASGVLAIAGSPSVTPSSITINFQPFDLDTCFGCAFGGRFEATFATEPLAAVPHPAAILLVLVGGLGLGALAFRRARA